MELAIEMEWVLWGSLAMLGFALGVLVRSRPPSGPSERARRLIAANQAQAEFAAAAERAMGDIRQSVSGLAGVVQGAQQRLAELERQFQLLENSALRVSRQQSFQESIALAQRGASADDIVSRCGLSRAEAELLAQVHAGRSNH